MKQGSSNPNLIEKNQSLIGASHPLAGNRDIRMGLKLSYVEQRDEEIAMGLEQVEDEQQYWKYTLIGYMIGEKVT